MVGAWPKLAATVIGLAVWQLVVWSGLEAVLHPARAGARSSGAVARPGARRPAEGHRRHPASGPSPATCWPSSSAPLLGVAVARSRVLRSAVGSLITGFQTMPSVAWLPLAIVLFQLTERAILFVLLIGAVPSIANGVIVRDRQHPAAPAAGRPGPGRPGDRPLPPRGAARPPCPAFVAGLKQGWAFAWRSLMAGELIVIIAHRPSLGRRLEFAAVRCAPAAVRDGDVWSSASSSTPSSSHPRPVASAPARLGERDLTGGTVSTSAGDEACTGKSGSRAGPTRREVIVAGLPVGRQDRPSPPPSPNGWPTPAVPSRGARRRRVRRELCADLGWAGRVRDATSAGRLRGRPPGPPQA